ncbi:MAG TPA: hypothetical protein VMF09_05525 [Solirubrobacteraceae bacterium]|nr:hypothetical protein [Solirubrobacteraceae bacterium]
MKEEAAVECASEIIQDEGWAGPDSEDETTSLSFEAPTENCKPVAKALNEEAKEVTNKCEKWKERMRSIRHGQHYLKQ